ncbi:M24 family metallopeptidase [Actinomadura violacea]|uniref:M24 family metallopeptidase n=1 Tax=Actinomadura violacea TaxID=2819934 RepID=A0ABS3S083_9ACTN|nr:M24 family metallopeptidase [Actinomadura violacea]MBO2462404.1 M24 family metallopeptidase [Actinomadura violacea]
MTAQAPVYSTAERDRRWALARELMDAEGVEALVVYGEHESSGPAPFAPDVYFTNERPGAIVVFPRDADPISLVWSPMHIADHIEARRRSEACWTEPRNMRVAKHAPGLVEVLKEHGLERAAIGVIGLEPYPPFHFNPIMPYGLWSAVLEQLPDATFKPVWLSFLLRTLTQSDEELAVLRHSAGIGEAMAQAMLDATRPGVTEADVYAAGMAAGFRLGAAAPGMLLQSGPGYACWGPPVWSYRPQAPRTIEDGDVIQAEVFCSYGMRESQHQVAIAVGEVHPDTEAAAKAARASYDAGIAALRPGATFGQVVTAMKQPMEDAGGWNVHPLVHGLDPYGTVCGFGSGMRELPEAADYGLIIEVPTIGSDLPLAPGMAFAFEPNCVLNGRLANIGGTVVVGEDGAIELNTLTTNLLRAD